MTVSTSLAYGPTVDSLLHSHLLWYLNRGTGVVLVAVLTLSTGLGLLSASGRGSWRWPRFARQSLHRNVSVIAVGLLVAHAVTPVLDTYVNHYAPISWVDALLPFVSSYKPLALGLGTLALDLIAVVVLSSIARHRFGHRAWFSLHLLSYAAWGLGLAHGFLIGSDARTTWGLGVTGAAVLVVLATLVARLVPASTAAPAADPEPVVRGRRRANRRERERIQDEAYGPAYGRGYGVDHTRSPVDEQPDPTSLLGGTADARYAPDHTYLLGQEPAYGDQQDDDLGYDPLAAPQTRRERRAGRRAQV